MLLTFLKMFIITVIEVNTKQTKQKICCKPNRQTKYVVPKNYLVQNNNDKIALYVQNTSNVIYKKEPAIQLRTINPHACKDEVDAPTAKLMIQISGLFRFNFLLDL